MKKILFPILITVIVIQLLVPAYSIWQRYDVLKFGEEIKMRVSPVDPYDAFRGRYVSLVVEDNLDYLQRKGKYGVLQIGDDGFAQVSHVETKKPKDVLYLVSEDDTNFYIPHKRYYMEEELAPKAEKTLAGDSEVYVTIRIKDDKSVISGLYINGVRAEDFLTEEKNNI